MTYHYDGADGIDDALSRLTRIADENDATTYVAYTYLGAGTVVQVDHPAAGTCSCSGGLTLSYGSAGDYTGFDRFGRVVQQTWTVDSCTVDSYRYEYDRNSNRTARTNLMMTDGSLDETYTYDGLDRLSCTCRGGSDFQSWDLDSLGNWDTFTDGSTTQARTHDAANQITAIDGDWITPEYDDAGNMISGPKPGEETTRLHFKYDAWNHLVKVQGDNNGDPGDTLAEYCYDGAGRRIAEVRWGRARTDYYLNESQQVLEERDNCTPNGGTRVHIQWLWDPRYVDAPVLRWHHLGNFTTETLYYTTDANWNVTALVDATPGNETEGQVVERYMYDPYGKATVLDEDWQPVTGNESAFGNDRLYAGYARDTETGLYHTQTREYHSSLGVWIERDMIGYADGMSLYQYCRSNPAGMTDPMGLEGEGNGWTEEDFQNWLAWEDSGSSGSQGAPAAASAPVKLPGWKDMTLTMPSQGGSTPAGPDTNVRLYNNSNELEQATIGTSTAPSTGLVLTGANDETITISRDGTVSIAGSFTGGNSLTISTSGHQMPLSGNAQGQANGQLGEERVKALDGASIAIDIGGGAFELMGLEKGVSWLGRFGKGLGVVSTGVAVASIGVQVSEARPEERLEVAARGAASMFAGKAAGIIVGGIGMAGGPWVGIPAGIATDALVSWGIDEGLKHISNDSKARAEAKQLPHDYYRDGPPPNYEVPVGGGVYYFSPERFLGD